MDGEDSPTLLSELLSELVSIQVSSKEKGLESSPKRTFHSLRHSFTSALANAGVGEEIRMKLTGHTTKSSHTRYTHLELGSLKRAVTALPIFTKPR